MKKTTLFLLAALLHASAANTAPKIKQGIWTSKTELAGLPMQGPAWETVLSDAAKDTSNPDVGNQNDNANCYVLAAAIVSARYDAAGRTGEGAKYRNQVVAAIDRIVAAGCPAESRSLAWGRELGAYVMAADLIGYRTPEFEHYLHDAADKWICSARTQTLREMCLTRPNNWGAMAFGSLCAVYAYLGDQKALRQIRDKWVTGFTGPTDKGFKFGSDLSWQADSANPMIINKKGSKKQGVALDGLQPEEMRRGAPFDPKTIAPTGYPFEALQGMLMAARILDRQGMSIWKEGNKALYRAVYALEVYLTNNFGSEWSFEGDDLWQLRFIDAAYGSDFSKDRNVWGHGKNAGYAYVTLHEGNK